jgi:hypothetical protein
MGLLDACHLALGPLEVHRSGLGLVGGPSHCGCVACFALLFRIVWIECKSVRQDESVYFSLQEKNYISFFFANFNV